MPELREEELNQLFQQAVSLHPSADELGLYHDGVADEVTGARIKAHLRRCPDCQERFDTMKHILATYHEAEVPPESHERLKALIAKTSTPQAQAATMKAIVGLVLFALDTQRRRQKIRVSPHGARAATKLVQDGQTEDGALGWRFEEDDYGDLVVYFDSPRLELENCQLALRIGPLLKEFTLKRVDKDQIGAKLRITREEREQLREDDDPVIEQTTPPE